MILSRERWLGIAPINVRRVGERHKIVKQTDSGFGVDARAGPGGFLEALLVRSLPHDLVMDGISPGSPSSPKALLIRSPSHDLVMGEISRAGSQ